MISDVLFEAVEQIDAYLAEMPDAYGGDPDRLARIIAVRDAMTKLRQELDAPPG